MTTRLGGDTGDVRLDLALAELGELTGDFSWSIRRKRKSLSKFGRRSLSANTPALIWEAPEDFETRLNVSDGNAITHVSSSSLSDVGQLVTIEGHYLGTTPWGTGLIFHVQRVTLNGRNKVALPQPLFRTDRAFIAVGASAAGDVNIYVDGALTNGVPTDTTLIHNVIKGTLGRPQSRKARLSLSAKDAFIVIGGQLSVGRASGSGTSVDFNLLARPALVEDSVFRPGTSEITLTTNGTGFQTFDRPIPAVIPPNFDVQVEGTATANSTITSATLFGYLAVRDIPQ